jgi:hypothetical protein
MSVSSARELCGNSDGGRGRAVSGECGESHLMLLELGEDIEVEDCGTNAEPAVEEGNEEVGLRLLNVDDRLELAIADGE